MAIKSFEEYKNGDKFVNESRATSRERLLKILRDKYPDAWFKKGENFDSEYEGSIWTGEGSMDDGIPLFDVYGPSSLYELGVYKELADLLDKHGWYAEQYDAGTFFLYKI